VQHRVQGVLNNVRDVVGKACMQALHPGNAALAMATCGAKGSPINIAQMVACVGQQSVGGKRCADGFAGRTIPHFPRYGSVPLATCADFGLSTPHTQPEPSALVIFGDAGRCFCMVRLSGHSCDLHRV
jgi:DNA-directed RNA polymerase beta' subunit